jgi:hypothetical protein
MPARPSVAKRTASAGADTPAGAVMRYLPCRDFLRCAPGTAMRLRPGALIQGSIMLLTIFCSISTGLAVFCILNRVQRRNIDIAVRLAVREAEKEFESRTNAVLAKLNAKDTELAKARNLVKLHETVPTLSLEQLSRPAGGAAGARAPAKKLKQDPLHVFEMSRPFTDTSYNDLLRNSDVVKVEPSAS